MKNKTLATWLTFFGGPLGLHRFYLRGLGDLWGWLLPVPTALGLYGIERVMQFGRFERWTHPTIPFDQAAALAACLIRRSTVGEAWAPTLFQ